MPILSSDCFETDLGIDAIMYLDLFILYQASQPQSPKHSWRSCPFKNYIPSSENRSTEKKTEEVL